MMSMKLLDPTNINQLATLVEKTIHYLVPRFLTESSGLDLDEADSC